MQRIMRVTTNRLFSGRVSTVGAMFESSRNNNMTTDYLNEYGVNSENLLRGGIVSLPLASLSSAEVSLAYIIDSTEEIMKLTSR